MDKIAIAISTRDRKEAFTTTLHHITEYLPDNSYLFTVDDASEEPTHKATYRFEERAGIPRVKNKCIELCIETDADHFFLFDNDCYPTCDGWYLPYIDSPYPLLCYTFYHPQRKDSQHTYFAKGNGCMMYIHRSVVERIGGFNTAFGLGKYEHTEYYERAHRAGIIPHPFIDVVNSNKLIHSMDEHNEVERTFTDGEIRELLNKNRGHYYNSMFSTKFIPYK